MIITTIRNNKLYIKFDSLVGEGIIYITDNENFKTQQKIKSSDFEVIDLQANSNKIHIQIEIGGKITTKTIHV